MDFQLNMKGLSLSTSSSSSSSSSSSTTTTRSTMKRSFHGKKLQYQEKIIEQSNLPQEMAALTPTYLTADRAWKTVATMVARKPENDRKRQDMELKTIGKMGMAKRKQFLQKRDISRSHEVKTMIFPLL